MRTATQIHATRFEQVTRAGVYADPSITGAVRRQILDAGKAVALYINAGEIKAGMAIAEELVAQAEKSDRHRPMAEHLKRMQTSLSVARK